MTATTLNLNYERNAEPQLATSSAKKYMNKSALVDRVAAAGGLSKKQAKNAVDAVVAAVSQELATGGKVQLVGFGTFEVRKRAARAGRNPQNGKAMSFPATAVPAFKAGKTLKLAVKEGA